MERPPTIHHSFPRTDTCASRAPTPRRWRLTATAAAAAVAALVTLGVNGDAVAQLQGMNLQCVMDSASMVTVTDMDNGRVLISPNRQPLWSDGGPGRVPAVKPDIAFESRPDGFNVHFTFVNNTTRRASLGEIYVPGIRFGRSIQSQDFKIDAKPVTIDHGNRNFAGGGHYYPETSYAPAAVIFADGYTIGASLHYAILDYKHRVFIRMESPGGHYIHPARNWQILFRMNPLIPQGLYSEEGEMAPGETRRYTLSVRILKQATGQHANEWLRTLEPYRRFFHSMYGNVRYQRDPRPMLGCTMAATVHLKPDNKLGFNPYYRFRADRYGFGPWVEMLNQARASGWERATLWAPSGLFYVNHVWNYPFQFTSHWKMYPAMAQSMRELKGLASRGFDLGLWWGRSGEVMKKWDTSQTELLDPDNAEHRRLAIKELDGAAEAGATFVGLDTFTHIPLWEAYPWLLEMQSRHPQIRFVVEPIACDLLHSIAASYMLGTTSPETVAARISTPHKLADFLNPGHETWAQISVGHLRESMGLAYHGEVAPEVLQREMRRIAAMGYVAHPFTAVPLSPPYEQFNAVESWRTTVPEGDQETLRSMPQNGSNLVDDGRRSTEKRIQRAIEKQKKLERNR